MVIYPIPNCNISEKGFHISLRKMIALALVAGITKGNYASIWPRLFLQSRKSSSIFQTEASFEFSFAKN